MTTRPAPDIAMRAIVPPRHIAIVMDGNGRWARRRGQPRSFGHRAGQKAVRAAVGWCLRNGVGVLTLFAFSSENWKRPQTEVGALMDLFLKALDKEIDELHKNEVRVHFVGELSAFSEALRTRMQAAALRTAGNSRLILNVCVSYGGRWDMAQAARRAAEAVARGELDPAKIDEQTLAGYFASPICRRPIFSSAPAANGASAISCCGNSLTLSSTSPTPCGPTLTMPNSTEPSMTMRAANAVSAALPFPSPLAPVD